MDELSKTLSDLQKKAESCSKSDRLVALDFLKKLISNLENVKDETQDGSQDSTICAIKKSDCSKDSRHKLPLKLTIRKFKTIESSFLCHQCNKTFITMKKMISHVVNSHTKAEVTCRICKGTFYCYNLLIIHECLCPMQTFFIHRQCGVCEKSFLQKREYNLHMKDEHSLALDKISKSFSCHICQMSFPLRSQLLVHSSQAHTETCLKEDPLTKKFSKITQNSVRIENETTASSNPKQKTVIKSRNWCTVCKRNFLSQKALNKHFLSYMHKVNTGELKMFKKFVCDVCDNSFNKMICLQRHVSSHHNDFAHKCNLCDYRTSEKCNLAEHMRRHYQIRNFACEFCDARFIAKRELKDHVAFKHNSLRPFECTDCGKVFKTKRILRRHAKTHSEFRPYVCACGSSFLRMTNLRRHHLTVHHDSNPTITKIQVTDEDTIDTDQLKDYWYADSKFIKNKKTTPLSLNKKAEKEAASTTRKETFDTPKIETVLTNPNMQMLNVNYVLKVSTDDDKDSKMYWSVNQNFLDQSDMQATNQSVDYSSLNGIISNKSSLHDSSVIDDSLNICDLVSSPSSYPLLVSSDQCDDPSTNGNKMPSYDLPSSSLKSDSISKYKVDSIMMVEPSESRSNMDGIWRPIDTLDDPSSSVMASNTLDMFPQNPGLISSFNEVFLTSVSNQCYPDDNVQWNGLSLSGNSVDYMYSGTVSACEPLCDAMPVSDSTSSNSADNFLYYNQPPQQHSDNSNISHPSFAYIDSSYSASNVASIDHNYGSGNHNFSAAATFCSGLNSQSYQQSHHMPDLFSLSYSSTGNSEFVQMPPNSSSISNILFTQDQMFHNATSLATNHHSWLHNQHSPINDFPSDNLPPLMLDSYKMPSRQMNVSNTGSSLNNPHPLRVLSPIDFFVSDGVFSTGIKHEYCLSDNALISDFCSQSHQFSNSSAQLCSKNFSVVNLISTACAATGAVSKDADDNDLLFSAQDESVV